MLIALLHCMQVAKAHLALANWQPEDFTLLVQDEKVVGEAEGKSHLQVGVRRLDGRRGAQHGAAQHGAARQGRARPCQWRPMACRCLRIACRWRPRPCPELLMTVDDLLMSS